MYFMLLCIFAAGLLAALAFSRRMLSQDLPEEIVTLAMLHESDTLTQQLEALAAQLHWTDNELVRTVWLVDCSPDGALRQQCMAFCSAHGGFQYCRQAEVVKIFGKVSDFEKNDCNLTKKQV